MDMDRSFAADAPAHVHFINFDNLTVLFVALQIQYEADSRIKI